jgi:hypothetical protein
MCHVACGLHLLHCGLPLFSIIFYRQSRPDVSGWNGLNIEFYSIGVSCRVLSRNAMRFVFPISSPTLTQYFISSLTKEFRENRKL